MRPPASSLRNPGDMAHQMAGPDGQVSSHSLCRLVHSLVERGTNIGEDAADSTLRTRSPEEWQHGPRGEFPRGCGSQGTQAKTSPTASIATIVWYRASWTVSQAYSQRATLYPKTATIGDL